MNIARLRELAAAGKDGTIRPEELKELFEVLPSVLGALVSPEHVYRLGAEFADTTTSQIAAPLDEQELREMDADGWDDGFSKWGCLAFGFIRGVRAVAR